MPNCPGYLAANLGKATRTERISFRDQVGTGATSEVDALGPNQAYANQETHAEAWRLTKLMDLWRSIRREPFYEPPYHGDHDPQVVNLEPGGIGRGHAKDGFFGVLGIRGSVRQPACSYFGEASCDEVLQ